MQSPPVAPSPAALRGEHAHRLVTALRARLLPAVAPNDVISPPARSTSPPAAGGPCWAENDVLLPPASSAPPGLLHAAADELPRPAGKLAEAPREYTAPSASRPSPRFCMKPCPPSATCRSPSPSPDASPTPCRSDAELRWHSDPPVRGPGTRPKRSGACTCISSVGSPRPPDSPAPATDTAPAPDPVPVPATATDTAPAPDPVPFPAPAGDLKADAGPGPEEAPA